MKRLFLLLVAAALAGCAVPAIPEGYSGPTAAITDNVTRISDSRLAIFTVTRVNDRTIENSAAATRRANQGAGMKFAFTDTVRREVPAQTLKLEIAGMTQSASDVQALFARNYFVSGIVELRAKPGGRYAVNGVLHSDRQAVWVEDLDSGGIVTRIVEKK